MHKLRLVVLPELFAICQLDNRLASSDRAATGSFWSMVRTADEWSLVCEEDLAPEGARSDRGWRCLRVAGTMDFSMVGVVASLVAPLADANVSVFVVSTFDTDYLLVRDNDLASALAALREAGHLVE